MNVPAVVKRCREFDYVVKSGKNKGQSRTAYSVDIFTRDYEQYSLFSLESYDPGEPCVMVISPGDYNKPQISLSRPVSFEF